MHDCALGRKSYYWVWRGSIMVQAKLLRGHRKQLQMALGGPKTVGKKGTGPQPEEG